MFRSNCSQNNCLASEIPVVRRLRVCLRTLTFCPYALLCTLNSMLYVHACARLAFKTLQEGHEVDCGYIHAPLKWLSSCNHWGGICVQGHYLLTAQSVM